LAGGGLQIELVGEIAKMVHLARESEKNDLFSGAIHDEFARSVKVVAGGRYQRYLPISEAWITKAL
jgi:hypothetical protein